MLCVIPQQRAFGAGLDFPDRRFLILYSYASMPNGKRDNSWRSKTGVFSTKQQRYPLFL
jgi:hypothetical protein